MVRQDQWGDEQALSGFREDPAQVLDRLPRRVVEDVK